jgi:Uncharacterized conserved protein (DUF2190)
MATEAPLIHDGSQCTAGVNMSATAALAGPNGTGQFLGVKLSAARTVIPVAATADVPYGILQNDPISGFIADIGILGVSKAVAGAAIAAGKPLGFDASGRVVDATGQTWERIGVAIEAATAINQIITILIRPTSIGG